MYLHQNFSIELVLCSATIFASLAFVSRFELCQTLLLSLMCVVEVPHNTRRDENTGAKALCVTLHYSKKNGYERVEFAGALRLLRNSLS